MTLRNPLFTLLACSLLHSPFVYAQMAPAAPVSSPNSATGTAIKVLKSEAEIKKLAETVMEQVVKNDFTRAFELAQPYFIVPESEVQVLVIKTNSLRDQYKERYGKSAGYELVTEKRAGESLLQLIYIEKTERNALPWKFIFYKSPSGWILNSLFWNDQANSAFE